MIISIRSNFRTDNFSRSWSVSKLAVRPFPMAVSGRNPEFEWAPLSLYGHHSTCMKDSQVSSVGYGYWVEKVKKMGFSGIRTGHLWEHGQKVALQLTRTPNRHLDERSIVKFRRDKQYWLSFFICIYETNSQNPKFPTMNSRKKMAPFLSIQVVSGFQKPCQLFYCQEVKKSCHRMSEGWCCYSRILDFRGKWYPPVQLNWLQQPIC